MRRLAKFCFTHRGLVVLGWVVALIAVTAIHSAAGSAYSDNFRLSGTQSFDAVNLLERNAPKASGDTEQVVIAVDHGRITDPAVRAQVESMLAALAPSAACLGGLLALRAARRLADLAVGAGRVRQRHVRRPGQQGQRRRSQGVRQRRARGRGAGPRRRGRGPGRRGGQSARRRRPSVRDPRRRNRPVHRVRLAAGDAAAARDRGPRRSAPPSARSACSRTCSRWPRSATSSRC